MMENVIYILFITKPNLSTIKIITLPKPKEFIVTNFGVKVGTKDLTFNFSHFEGQIQVNNTTLTCIKI
jgi:hypothetical protein